VTDGDNGQPMNREQRRAERFGSPDNRQDNLATQGENEALGGGAATTPGGEGNEALPGGNRDVAGLSGAGTGGATESDDRLLHHEGMHLGNQPNS
jgi:hypothetical protein